MAKLIVNPTSSSRREISLPRSLLSIGRDPSNDLVLPDAMVSRRHAVVEYRGNQYFLRDCNSSNGSLVNGDRVSERSLRDGDLVAIGTARLLFRDDLAADVAGAKVVQHPSAPRLSCPACGADFRKGDQFCRQCGGPLVHNAPPKAVCVSCGTAVLLPAQYCNACGQKLATGDAALDVTKPRERPELPGGTVLAEPGGAEADRPADASPEPREGDAAGDPPSSRPVDVGSPGSSMAARPGTRAAVAVEARSHMALTPPARPSPSAALSRAEPRTTQARPAGFGRRLLAGAIDGIVAGAAFALVVSPVAIYWHYRWARQLPAPVSEPTTVPILLTAALLALAVTLTALYFVYFWGVRGATPGKQILELAVEDEDGGSPIGVSRAVIRFLGCLLSVFPLLGVGFLMIAFTGSAFHDRLAGTRVVHAPRG